MHPAPRAFCLLFFFLLLSGCATHPMNDQGNPESPYPPTREPAVGDIFHYPTGLFVAEEAMLADVSDARIVYVGETHDNPAAHRLQVKVLRAMATRWPGEVALGMEMFTPAQQPVLDAWVAGELSEKEFIKQSGWFKGWKMDFALYRELLELARDEKIPVRGLNADRELVRAVGRNMPGDLPAEQQEQLPEMDMNDPYQGALVEAIFGGHSAGKAMLDGFHRVQTLWDETMAANIATYLSAPDRSQMRMVVVAGGNHVRYGFGIPRRVFRRLPTSYALVGSRELSVPEERQDRLMDVNIPEFPMPPYHYLAYTEYEIHDADAVKLGVMLGEDDSKVTIGPVLPGSNAEKAGLQEGDVILQIGAQEIAESFDLIYAIKQLSAGDQATLLIERSGEEIEVPVVFEKSPPMEHHGKKP